jgi:hypothetical protein
VSPKAFDEDLSELGESDKSSEVGDEAECECDCGFEDVNDEDNESEKTCEGSEAAFYYEMKDCRRERKKSLLQERKTIEKEKESAMEISKSKEEEVNTAYTAFKKTQRRAKKKGETIPLDFVLGRRGIVYDLFSTQHVEWLFLFSMYSTQRADFYYLDECHGGFPPQDGEEGPMFGMIYINAEATCKYGPIAVPTQARRKTVKVIGDETYELKFKFFGKKYLKLSVPRAVIDKGIKLPPHAPETFDFVGILRDTSQQRDYRGSR